MVIDQLDDPRSLSLRIGPERSRAREAAKRTLDGEDRSGILRDEGKGRAPQPAREKYGKTFIVL